MTVRDSSFQAIGTHWDIQVYDKLSDDAWVELMQKIFLRIQSFDEAYSRFRTDSLVTRISETAGKYELPSDGYMMLHFYKRLYEATDGKVTPLIGQAVADAGYDASYSFKKKALRRPPRWENTLLYSKDAITLKQPVLLDFGAAGKGYLVDNISALMERAGLRTYTINAGGDILHRSVQQSYLEVGLENPVDTSEAIGIARIGNKSLGASAGSKRKWGDFHHIIDPVDLKSPEDIIATWVIANDTMTADGLATALFFTNADQLMKQFSFSYAVLDKDMNLYHAKDFPLTLFKAE